jgi:hypothetical protein
MGAEPSTAIDARKEFQQAGFEVAETGAGSAALEVRKNNCARLIRRQADGAWTLEGPPYFIVRGLQCELEDHGYQKFWYHEGKRFPIRLQDLRTLHRFEEEVRYLLGFKSLYNESLGSTCARTVYDRMQGRRDQ